MGGQPIDVSFSYRFFLSFAPSLSLSLPALLLLSVKAMKEMSSGEDWDKKKMTKMSELLDKDFKATVIKKKLKKPSVNNYEQPEINEKMEGLSKETEDVNKNQMEILELENTINEIKSLEDRLNNQVEVTEETTIELED